MYVCIKNLYFITTDYILKPVLSSCVVINVEYSNQITFATLTLLFLFVSLKRLQSDTSQLQEQQKGKLLSCNSSLAGSFCYILNQYGTQIGTVVRERIGIKFT